MALGLLSPACTSEPTPAPRAASRAAPNHGQPGFADVASDVGLDFRHGAFRWDVSPDPVAAMGSGVCWLDYDGDGWLDLFVVNSFAQDEAARWEADGGLPRSALFHNVQGRFVDVSASSDADLAVRGTGCVAADLDLDGRTDLYVTTAQAGALLWNDGDGTFTEGAEAAGAGALGWYAGAAVGDVNADGWPDLFLAGYANVNAPIEGATQGFPGSHLGVRDLLYVSNGRRDNEHVTFREAGADAGLEVVDFMHGLGAAFSDLDLDGDPDLYVANDTTPNRLYENVRWPGGAAADPLGLGFRFEELAGRAGVADPNAGMGVAVGDFDGDGRPDLFVTNARDQVHAFYRSRISELVDPSFADVRSDLGLDLTGSTGWGVSWMDLDLDTDLDLVVVNGDVPVRDLAADAEPVQVFENLTAQGDPGGFEDRSGAPGLGPVGRLLARGSAAADYDNDGDLDLAITTVGGRLVLVENRARAGNWLEVAPDRFSPGAEVRALLPTGRELTCEVRAGSSYLSSEDPRCHFGLGGSTEVRELTVLWPDGGESILKDVEANQILEVEAPS